MDQRKSPVTSYGIVNSTWAIMFSDSQGTASNALKSFYETFAVRDIDHISSVYAREPEPESDFWEHEARDLDERDEGYDTSDDIPHNHSTRELDETVHTDENNHHQRRAALDYVMDLAARSVDPDDYEDERMERREQLERILELAARYVPPQSQSNDKNDNGYSRRNLADEDRLEARSALGMALRPFAKELGNVIQQTIVNKMHRRDQHDDEEELDARDLHDEVHDELVARSAFGMAFRPIAQELGRAFRTAILEKVKRREVEELEMRSAFGMAFRPIAQELGRAFRTAVLEKVKRDGALESREDVADSVESAPDS